MSALNSHSLHYYGLQVRLALARLGWSAGIAVALCLIGGASLLWFIPQLRVQGEANRHALLRAQNSLNTGGSAEPATPQSVDEDRIAKFYDALGERRYAEQQIKTLFAIAAKTGLNLNQAEYKSALDKNSKAYTYQILLPVKGTYPAIRHFCEQTLRAIPFASLDEMSFKRDGISSAELEARLRITLYLSASAVTREKSGVPQ